MELTEIEKILDKFEERVYQEYRRASRKGLIKMAVGMGIILVSHVVIRYVEYYQLLD